MGKGAQVGGRTAGCLGERGLTMQVEMSIKGLMVDSITNTPIVILHDGDGQRVLPIWVGLFEANAIALQIENISMPRPMTHDLLRNVIHDLKADVQKIVISDLKENTFYAVIHVVVAGEVVVIDARPSDAIVGVAGGRADLRRRHGHRQREAAGHIAGHGGLRAAAELARGDRPRRTGEIQDVGWLGEASSTG